MNRNRSRIAITLLTFAAFSLGACDTIKPPPAGPQDQVPGDQYPAVTVEVPLQSFMVIDYGTAVVDRPTETKPLFVQIPARSTADRQMVIQYQYTWFDEARRELGKSGWRMVSVDPRLQVMLSGNAMDPKATQWRLEVRSAR